VSINYWRSKLGYRSEEHQRYNTAVHNC